MKLIVEENEFNLESANINYYRLDSEDHFINLGVETDTPEEDAKKIGDSYKGTFYIEKEDGTKQEFTGYTLFSIERNIDDNTVKTDYLRINLRKE